MHIPTIRETCNARWNRERAMFSAAEQVVLDRWIARANSNYSTRQWRQMQDAGVAELQRMMITDDDRTELRALYA